MKRTIVATFVLALLVGCLVWSTKPEPAKATLVRSHVSDASLSVIVQAEDVSVAARVVHSVGGAVTHQLGIIHSVAANVTPSQLLQLGNAPGVRVYENRTARLSAVSTIVRRESVIGGALGTFTLPSIPGGGNQTYVLFVGTRKSEDVSSVSGGGLTWVERRKQCAGRVQTGLRLWTAQGSPAAPFQVTINRSGTRETSAVLTRYSGVGAFEDVSGGNSFGENGACNSSTGVDNTIVKMTLASSGGDTVHVAGVALRNRRVEVADPVYTLVKDCVYGDSGSTTHTYVYDKAFVDATADVYQATLDDTEDWAAAGIVLRASAQVADQDVDSLSDTVETGTGVYVSPTDTGTDPQAADSDGDGYEDGEEIEKGWDPLDPASPPPTPPVAPANCGDLGFDCQETYYPTLVKADQLHAQGKLGHGITIAFVDTGIIEATEKGATAFNVLGFYDATHGDEGVPKDSSGHGTHVASIAVSSLTSATGKYNGVAPGADVVMVKAFQLQGNGKYADIIRGIDWVVTNKTRFGIRVLNLSFSAPPRSFYWDDPLNQAVMRAWQAGIVVVTSAGNLGPDPMTIGVPGNVPYVITVGAVTDNYSTSASTTPPWLSTPTNPADDRLASFSSTGPTYEGFVKPDFVAPGGHMRGIMNEQDYLAEEHPEFKSGPGKAPYFTMSGTSQAAGVVSGVVALILQVDPSLTPDTVKCRLMNTARPDIEGTGQMGYTVFQEGAGLVDAYAAAYNTASGCANQGLNITNDLTNVDHYAGLARYNNVSKLYYLKNVSGSGYSWNSGFSWNSTFGWNSSYSWNSAFGWNTGYSWNNTFGWNSGFGWNSTFGWNSAFTWNSSCCTSPYTATFSGYSYGKPSSVNAWVEQQ